MAGGLQICPLRAGLYPDCAATLNARASGLSTKSIASQIQLHLLPRFCSIDDCAMLFPSHRCQRQQLTAEAGLREVRAQEEGCVGTGPEGLEAPSFPYCSCTDVTVLLGFACSFKLRLLHGPQAQQPLIRRYYMYTWIGLQEDFFLGLLTGLIGAMVSFELATDRPAREAGRNPRHNSTWLYGLVAMKHVTGETHRNRKPGTFAQSLYTSSVHSNPQNLVTVSYTNRESLGKRSPFLQLPWPSMPRI